MILNKKPVTLAEAREIVEKLDEAEELKHYFKRFTKLTLEQATKLKEELQNLNNAKLKEEHIVKIVDFLPKEREELNLITADANLSEEEANAILEIVKKY
ncbi:hypothetical protein D6817_02160 [Candidatus Pacearchaeota archaeon]|nr:MAG: hypothetical protein D6817_02160 [Candidatus Pacearchaeota archaeon]